MLIHAFTQPGKIIVTTRNKRGDQKVTGETAIVCRFRYVTELDKGVNREGLMANSDACVWLKPDAPVEEGSILFVDDKYWRVNRLVKARKLSGDTVEFLKAFVNVHTL